MAISGLKEYAMGTNRLEAFSDGVIAIIITIMVLEMKVPHDASVDALFKLWPIFFSYALSFLIVAIYWVNHHHLMHMAQHASSRVLWTNNLLLFWLSLMPFVTGYMGENHFTPLSVALYGALATLCSISFFFLRHAISREHHHDDKLMGLHRQLNKKHMIAQLFTLSSVATAFVSVPLALVLLAMPPLMYFLPDKRIEQHGN